MTQLHFTVKQEEIQNLIENSVKDDLSKSILTTVFNQLMRSREINTLVWMSMNEQTLEYPQETVTMSVST